MTSAPILYWFAKTLDVPAPWRARFELSGRFRGCRAAQSDGPEASVSGCLATPYEVIGGLTYSPLLQRWDKLAPGVWIGAARRATPADFARAEQRPGVEVEMGDGHRWLIPIANPYVARCTLPQWHRLGLDGHWDRVVVDAYLAIAERAADIAARMRAAVISGSTSMPVGDTELRDVIAAALAVNYDLTIAECSVLRLFTDETITVATHVLVDWPAIERALNAIAASGGEPTGAPFANGASATTAGNSTAPGQPAASPATPPAAPISSSPSLTAESR